VFTLKDKPQRETADREKAQGRPERREPERREPERREPEYREPEYRETVLRRQDWPGKTPGHAPAPRLTDPGSPAMLVLLAVLLLVVAALAGMAAGLIRSHAASSAPYL